MGSKRRWVVLTRVAKHHESVAVEADRAVIADSLKSERPWQRSYRVRLAEGSQFLIVSDRLIEQPARLLVAR